MSPIPSVLAILICEKVIEEAHTTKKSLIGIINRLHATAFPVIFPLGFYARLTDCDGQYSFRVDVVGLKETTLIARLTSDVSVAGDRLGFVELALNMPPIPFPAPDRYEFQLYGNDVYLAHITLDGILYSGT